MLAQSYSDLSAAAFFGAERLVSYGIELGNWYGFVGMPAGYGLCSACEVREYSSNEAQTQIQAHVVMPNMRVVLDYQSTVQDDELVTGVDLRFLEDGLLGDLVLHAQLAGSPAGEGKINGEALLVPRRYHYQYENDEPHRLDVDHQFSCNIHCTAEGVDDFPSLQLVPYAARVDESRIRFHSRLLTLSGEGAELLLRTRGALSCFRLASDLRWFDSQLYRVERNSPRLLPNTQLCSAVRVPAGTTIRLQHRVTR